MAVGLRDERCVAERSGPHPIQKLADPRTAPFREPDEDIEAQAIKLGIDPRLARATARAEPAAGFPERRQGRLRPGRDETGAHRVQAKLHGGLVGAAVDGREVAQQVAQSVVRLVGQHGSGDPGRMPQETRVPATVEVDQRALQPTQQSSLVLRREHRPMQGVGAHPVVRPAILGPPDERRPERPPLRLG